MITDTGYMKPITTTTAAKGVLLLPYRHQMVIIRFISINGDDGSTIWLTLTQLSLYYREQMPLIRSLTGLTVCRKKGCNDGIHTIFWILKPYQKLGLILPALHILLSIQKFTI